MKSIYFLIVGFCLMLLSCNKKADTDDGQIVYKLKFEVSQTNSQQTTMKSAKTLPQLKTADYSLHTQFGDYITSLTPYTFTADLRFLFAQSRLSVVNFITNDNPEHPELFVDFSSSQEIASSPQIMRYDISSDGEYKWICDGKYAEDEITFTYFCFIPYYFYQEIELPVEYKNIALDEFNRYYNISVLGLGLDGVQYSSGSVQSGNVLKVNYYPLIIQNEDHPVRFNFGSLASDAIRFISNDTSTEIDGSFPPITVSMPRDGETKNVYSTITFNTTNLIQLYAGTDNIPYTKDDIVVYAPEYWKRLLIKMEER